nr:hypothetical protein [Brevirhabdus pacifica]
MSKILTVSYGTFSCTLEGFDEPFTTMKAIAEYFRDLAAEDRYFGAEPPVPDADMLHRIAENAIQKRVSAQLGDNSVTLRPSQEDDGEGAQAAPAAQAASDTPATAEAPAKTAEATVAKASDADNLNTAAAVDPSITAREALADDASDGESDSISGDEIEDALAARRADRTTPEAETAATPATDIPAEASDEGYEEEEVDAADPVNAPIVESVAEKLARIRASVASDRAARSRPAEEPQPTETPASDATPEQAAAEDTPEEVVTESVIEETEITVSETVETFHIDADAQDEDEGEDEIAAWADAEETASEEDVAAQDDVQDEAEGGDADDAAILAALGSLESDAAPEVEAEAEAEEVVAEDTAEELPAEEIAEETAPEVALTDGQTSDEADLSDVIGAAMGDTTEVEETEEVAASDAEEEVAAEDDTPATAGHEFEDALAAALDDEIAGAEQPEIVAQDDTATEAEVTEVAAKTTAEAADEASDEGTEDAAEKGTEVSEAAITPSASDLVQMRRVRVLKVRRSVVEGAEAKAEARALTGEEDDREGDRVALPLREQSGRARLAQIGIAHDGPAVERIIAATNDRLQEDDNRRRVNAISHLKAAVAATNAERKARGGAAVAADEAADYRQDLQQVVRPDRAARAAIRAMAPAEKQAVASTAEEMQAEPEAPRERPAPLVLVSEQRIDQPSNHALELLQKRRIMTGGAERATHEELANAQSFTEFAEELGASELTDLLEAAAAYVSFVEGRPHFTRPHIMGHVAQVQADRGYSREDGLRSFGTLLRNGAIRKLKRGQFVIAEDSKFAPEARYAGE